VLSSGLRFIIWEVVIRGDGLPDGSGGVYQEGETGRCGIIQ